MFLHSLWSTNYLLTVTLSILYVIYPTRAVPLICMASMVQLDFVLCSK